MLGDDLRAWFELFDGIAVFRPKPGGGHDFDGWLNWSDIESRFMSGNLKFDGVPYDFQRKAQRNKLLDGLLNYANALVCLRLLERRRQISPSSLDYRLTPLGRRVGNWGYGGRPGFRKRAFFFTAVLLLRAYKLRGVVAVGAAGWAILNALKFYSATMTWAESLPFAAWSATAVVAGVVLWAIIKEKFG